jgi:hypothetical protein
MFRGRYSYILIVVYVLIGAVVASQNNYFATLNTLTGVVSAILAILLWPLVLLGVNLNVS